MRSTPLNSKSNWNPRRWNFAIIGFLLISISSCERSANVAEISIVDLIVRPDNHHGKVIVTEGYFSIDEQARLYVSREDAMYRLKTNSIVVADESLKNLKLLQACSQSYVQVLARFNRQFSLDAIQSIKTHDLENTLLTKCWEKPS